MSQLTFPEKTIFICDGSKCSKHKELRKIFKESIKNYGLKDTVEIVKIECTDRCKHAPVMCFQPQNKWLTDVSMWEADKIFKEMVLD
ncbi:(2Fe-2S) ferredoxin domain-containing protein [Arcicella sp. LKC2W]|uniref:(2Fe-2S) ferredoxin domain-containing protein n=1 Tax=Arcicella sp. LKC2W TaxID=2984198 RepID=UPI002B20E05B|nr:(2Fe-2S) ferredoxin domain-containing protein [Arcicella sp. LKC2W]MEA5461521.1 (2Fe-2S) ferredoxin domain-containing protein [Arcicella sp. LKC2W]